MFMDQSTTICLRPDRLRHAARSPAVLFPAQLLRMFRLTLAWLERRDARTFRKMSSAAPRAVTPRLPILSDKSMAELQANYRSTARWSALCPAFW